MHHLRILINFCSSTLVDEICQIASIDKAIAKAKLIPLVFFRCHGSATSASSASLRPFGIACISCITSSRAPTHVKCKIKCTIFILLLAIFSRCRGNVNSIYFFKHLSSRFSSEFSSRIIVHKVINFHEFFL